MKSIFKKGDKKVYIHKVSEQDVAAFHGETVHPVYATFALARDMEWSGRLFVLDMLEDDEQGIGTFINIDHKSPAFVNEEAQITAIIEEINGHEIICNVEVTVASRVIAKGSTGQKILKKEKLERLFNSIKNG
ncbi:thioesterase family protein [Peijinzhouia sedimentorum]|tara:strand:- start:637 stop:1035 length:399 start_codon:yes stop_codon:yes gene_type:complete